MILLTLTLGSRKYFLSESPSLQMIAWCTRWFWRYSPMFYRVPCTLRRCDPTTNKSLGVTTYIVVHTVIPRWSYYYKIPWISPYLFREYLVPTALQFLATCISLRIITRSYRVSIHPQLFLCSIRYFVIQSELSRTSVAYCSIRSYMPTPWLIPYA